MKVLHVYKGFFPHEIGGVGEFIRQLTLTIKNDGIESHLLALKTDNHYSQETIDGINVHWYPINCNFASTPFSISAYRNFNNLANQFDLIHYHYPYPFADLLHKSLNLKKPSIVTYHSDIVKQKFLSKIYMPLQNQFLNEVDKIVATSPQYCNTSKVLQKYKHKVCIIPIGLSDELSKEPSDMSVQKWSKKLPSRFFLFVGALRYYKGLHILLKAARLNDYPIVILGDGALKNKLHKQKEKLNLKNVHFVGNLSDEDKVALYKLSYAVILPSHLRSEALGVSLIEAQMHKKPLISCEIGTGTSYVNINKETGLVVPPNNPKALSSAMTYLNENKDEASEMGQKSFDRFKNIFTADKMAQSYLELYKDVLSRKLIK